MSVRTTTLLTHFVCLAVIAILSCAATLVMAQESTETTETAMMTSSTTTGSSSDSVTATETTIEPTPVRDVRQPALQLQGQKRITNLAANMSNRMDSTVYRMQNVVVRLKSRLAILDSENVDTTQARTTLAAAEAKITLASTALKTIDAEVAAFVGSEDPKEAWTPVRNTFGAIRDALLDAHADLQSTLDSMKAALVVPTTISTEATSTTTVNPLEVIE